MSLDEDGTFTIIWRLKNFSMCPLQIGECINSPIVQVRQFCESEWRLILYPQGINENAGNFVSCFLHCYKPGTYKDIHIEITFSVLNGPLLAFSEQAEHVFKGNETFGLTNWIQMENIFHERDKYLPLDTFTIKCVMKVKRIRYFQRAGVDIIDSFLSTGVLGKNSLYFNKCCCCETIISVQTKKFIHQLTKSFLNIIVNEGITLPLLSVTKETPSFYVTLLKGDTPFIHIKVKLRDEIKDNILVKFIVSAGTVTKGVLCSSEADLLFEPEADELNLPSLELKKLEEAGYFKVNHDILVLQFKFAFSIRGGIYHSEKQFWEPPFLSPESPLPLEMLTNTDDKQSAVTLETRDKNFIVHKSVLVSNSVVFHSMFENDTREKVTGKVDILDVDSQTMERVLCFLYSEDIGELSTTEVSDLYAAAHRYRIQSLMNYCSSVFMSSLKISNVCEVMILADRYHISELLKCAEDFIVNLIEYERLFMSQDWKKLMENHASIAANIMYKMLMK